MHIGKIRRTVFEILFKFNTRLNLVLLSKDKIIQRKCTHLDFEIFLSNKLKICVGMYVIFTYNGVLNNS